MWSDGVEGKSLAAAAAAAAETTREQQPTNAEERMQDLEVEIQN